MIRLSPIILALTLLGACSGPELSTIAEIKSDMPGFLDQEVSLSGTLVKHDSKTTYVWGGAASYFNLDDGTGHMNIWYGIGMRCSPSKKRGLRSYIFLF